MAVILVVDDEIGIRELLSEILSDEGYGVLLAENASAARSAMTQHPDLVLLDIWMPDNDGVSLLKEWNATGQLNVPVIMMSGHATLDTAVEATKFGAVDFLEKPIALSRLISSVKEALAKSPREPKIGTAARPQYNRVEPAPIRSVTQAPIPAALPVRLPAGSARRALNLAASIWISSTAGRNMRPCCRTAAIWPPPWGSPRT